MDPHENFHALHFEAVERATATEEVEPVYDTARTRRMPSLVSATQFEQAISEMKERILTFEKQLASIPTNADQPSVMGNISAADLTRDGKVTFEDSVENGLDQQQMIPQLHERSWSDFMNKQVREKHEYAIEVLVEEPKYQPPKEIARTDRKQSNIHIQTLEHNVRADSTPSEYSDEAMPIPERIRINSSWILNFLASIDRKIDITGPMVMLRPFKFLIYYENQIKDSIRALEDQLEGSETITSTNQSAELLIPESSSKTYEESTMFQGFENNQMTLQHARCLTELIDRYIKPTIVRLENNTDGKIRFRDLWYIFRPGDDVYMPLQLSQGPVFFDAVMTTPEMLQGRYHVIWRVTGTGGGRQNLSVGQRRHTGLKHNPFKVNCYYIDFDGRYFCPTTHTFSILPFEGDRDILSLDFFPIRFWKAAQPTIKEYLDKGKKVFDNIANSFTHYYYAGPTLTSQPCGCPIQKDLLHQEHVESEVIVDFKMTLIKNPSWRPNPSFWKDAPAERRELLERYPVRYWNDRGRSKLSNMEYEHIYDDYDIDEKISLTFKSKEIIFAPIPSSWLGNASMVPEKDVILMPGRVFAFVLRTRSFGKPPSYQ